MTTLRAVFMDLATDLGEAGLKWVLVLTMHGGPTHNQALDQAAQYFNETYGGRMVHVTGLTSVVGAVLRRSLHERATHSRGLQHPRGRQ